MGIRGSVDLSGKSAADVEREGSTLEPGWYRATVQDIREDDGNLKIEFKLKDGRKYTETLWDPDRSEDEEKGKKSQQRRNLFAIRLGLVPREAKDTAYEFDWLDAIGRECVLKLAFGKPNAEGLRYANIEWAGIFETHDNRVPAELRTTPPAGAAAASTNGHAVPTFATASGSQPAAASRPAFNLDDL